MYWILISAITLIFGLWVSKVVFRTIRCPLGIFTIVWNGLFFLHNLHLVEYYEVTIEVGIIILGSYLIFLIGSVLTKILMNKKNYDNILDKRVIDNEEAVLRNSNSVNKAINFSIFISIIGIIIWTIAAIRIIGFNTDMYVARNLIKGNINVIYIYLVNVGAMGGSILAGLLVAKGNRFRKRYIFIFLPTAIVSFFTGQRFMTVIIFIIFFAPIITTVSSTYINKYRKGQYKLFLVSISSMSIFFYLVGKKRGSFEELVTTGILTNPSLMKIYLYITGSFAAFSEYLKVWDGNLMFGVNTFLPIFKVTNSLGLTNYDYSEFLAIEVREFIKIPTAFNVYTYLLDILKDWGYFGFFVVPLFLGISSCFLWIEYNKTKLVTSKGIIYSFLMLYLIFSFISSVSSYSTIWYAYIYAFVLLNVFRYRLKIR